MSIPSWAPLVVFNSRLLLTSLQYWLWEAFSTHELLLQHASAALSSFHLYLTGPCMMSCSGQDLAPFPAAVRFAMCWACRAANLRPHLNLKGRQSGLLPKQPRPLPTAQPLRLQRLLLPPPLLLLSQQQSSSLATGWGLSIGLSVCPAGCYCVRLCVRQQGWTPSWLVPTSCPP